jgi:hypothetical protein
MNSPRVVVPVALLAAAIATTPAHAKSAKVKKATLSWSQTNVYNTAAPAGTERTWAGYTVIAQHGTVTPLNGATGQTISSASAVGKAFTQSYKGKKGMVDIKKVKGSVTLKGIVEFKSALFTTTLENPKVVLKGKTGQLFASGKSSDTTAPTYSNKAVLNLDLSKATVSKKKTKLTIKGIVPSIATANLAFPINYPVGAGPDRTPNTFGSFALTVAVKSSK